MKKLPLALGLGAVGIIALTSRRAGASEVERKLATVMPSRLRGSRGRGVIVPFTLRKVFWKVRRKTGQPLYRTEVVEAPAVLAAEASRRLGRKIPLETFTLAALMASEAGGGPELARVAIAHAALTAAKRAGRSLHEQVTQPFGTYGGELGKYAASKNSPTEGDLELAEAVLAKKIGNPAPGANQWDSPRAQRALVARGEAGYGPENTPEAVEQRRRSANQVPVYLPGVDREYLRLWRPAA